MLNWLCNIGTVWGLILTGVGLIVGTAIVIIGGIWAWIGIQFLWDKVPYRIANPIEKVLFGIWIAFAVVVLLAFSLLVIAVVYSEICPNWP